MVRGTLINLGFYAHAAAVLGAELLPLRSWLDRALFAGPVGSQSATLLAVCGLNQCQSY